MSEATHIALFSARTVRIHAPNLLEARIELGLGVQLDRLLALEGVQVPADAQLRARAMHCLIVLAGGKRLIVAPLDGATLYVSVVDRARALMSGSEPTTPETPIGARVYLDEVTYDTQVGHTFGILANGEPVLELAPFMIWLGQRGYDLADVTQALNGSRGRRG